MKVSRHLFLSTVLALATGTLAAKIPAVPHPAVPIDAKTTTVWSPLFQATWDQIKQETGKFVSVVPENPLISKLESFQWDAAKTMPEGSWKTWSGPASEEFLEQVNKEAAEMTGEPEGPFKVEGLHPDSVMALGLLDHEVEFSHELFRAKTVPMKFKSDGQETDVCFFGAKDGHPAIRVLSWLPAERSHAIRILCKDSEDSVILFLPGSPSDFESASLKVKTWLDRKEVDVPHSEVIQFLYQGDQLRIPYLALESNSEFAGQLDGTINFQKRRNMRVAQASQLTRFKLHEKGAKVRSEAILKIEPFGGPPKSEPKPPRAFIYDRPFFVFLWKKDAAWPYFAAWVGDSSAMEKWNGPAGN